MSIQKNVTATLKLIHIQSKLSLVEFAEALGIGRSSLQEYLSEKRCPKIDTLELIAEKLKIPIDAFVSGKLTLDVCEPFPKKRTQKVKKKWNDSRDIRYRWLCSGAEKIILKTRGRNPTQSRVRAEGVVEDFQIGKDIALRRRSGWIVF